ncbi:hypothetical protein FF1_038870 [Malus domestica]
MDLAEEVKKELEDPHGRYSFGWSRGKEKLKSGKSETPRTTYDLRSEMTISNALVGVDRKDLMRKLSKFIYEEEKALENACGVVAMDLSP